MPNKKQQRLPLSSITSYMCGDCQALAENRSALAKHRRRSGLPQDGPPDIQRAPTVQAVAITTSIIWVLDAHCCGPIEIVRGCVSCSLTCHETCSALCASTIRELLTATPTFASKLEGGCHARCRTRCCTSKRLPCQMQANASAFARRS